MTSSKRTSEPPERPLPEVAQSFNYAALDTETRIVVQQRTSEIKERLRDAARATWEVGQKLVDVRNCLEYGQFNLWLKTEFQWSRSTAYNYINIFESFGSCPNFGQLDIAISALYLLAAPSTPETAREEALERAVEGETISSTKAKAIANHHKKLAGFSNASEPVTINISAETIEKESTSCAEAELVERTQQNQSPINEEVLVDEVVQNKPAIEDQSEQEIRGKEVETELLPSEISNSEQAIPEGELNSSIKDQRARQMERQSISVTEICKNLIASIEYLHREDIVDLIDPLSLKSLMEQLTILFERTEVSLKKRCNSSYSNN